MLERITQIKINLSSSSKVSALRFHLKIIKRAASIPFTIFDVNDTSAEYRIRDLVLRDGVSFLERTPPLQWSETFLFRYMGTNRLDTALEAARYLYEEHTEFTLLHAAAMMPAQRGVASIEFLKELGGNLHALTSKNYTPYDFGLQTGKLSDVTSIRVSDSLFSPDRVRDINHINPFGTFIIPGDNLQIVLDSFECKRISVGEIIEVKSSVEAGWVRISNGSFEERVPVWCLREANARTMISTLSPYWKRDTHPTTKLALLLRSLEAFPPQVSINREFGTTSRATASSDPSRLTENKQFRVLYDFKKGGRNELTVKKGDIVIAMENSKGDGWIQVKVSKPGTGNSRGGNVIQKGYVPESYLRLNSETNKFSGAATSATASSAAGISPSKPKLDVEQRAECPICFEPSALEPIAVFLEIPDSSKRSCRHFLHRECLENLVAATNKKQCPICRKPFSGFAQVPDFDVDPRKWFDLVDYERNKVLSKSEVLDACRALLPIDFVKLEREVDTLWPMWTSGKQNITFSDLCLPNGLLEFVRTHFPRPPSDPSAAPSLSEARESKVAWFRFWDENRSGSLSHEDIVRGVIKTYNLSSDMSKMEQLRDIIQSIWPVMCASEECTLEKFVQADGLGDSLISSLAPMSSEPSRNRHEFHIFYKQVRLFSIHTYQMFFSADRCR